MAVWKALANLVGPNHIAANLATAYALAGLAAEQVNQTTSQAKHDELAEAFTW